MLQFMGSQKTKIRASGPITSRQTDGEKVGTVSDFIFLGSKITADSDCSHKIKDAYSLEGASLISQLVKNLPAIQETSVPFLAQEDPLEKE